jgi:hypothetical protein
MDPEGDLQLYRLSVSTRNLTTITGEIRVRCEHPLVTLNAVLTET